MGFCRKQSPDPEVSAGTEQDNGDGVNICGGAGGVGPGGCGANAGRVLVVSHVGEVAALILGGLAWCD